MWFLFVNILCRLSVHHMVLPFFVLGCVQNNGDNREQDSERAVYHEKNRAWWVLQVLGDEESEPSTVPQ